jgi:transposase
MITLQNFPKIQAPETSCQISLLKVPPGGIYAGKVPVQKCKTAHMALLLPPIGRSLLLGQLEVHLERKENAIVCPRCQTCCSRVKESRPRCIRDLPILEHPTVLWLHLRRFARPSCRHRPWEKSETFGTRTKWTERLYNQVCTECLQGCPGKELARRCGLSERTVFRWTFDRSRGGRPRKLGRVIGLDDYARRKGHRYNTLIINVDTGKPIC